MKSLEEKRQRQKDKENYYTFERKMRRERRITTGTAMERLTTTQLSKTLELLYKDKPKQFIIKGHL